MNAQQASFIRSARIVALNRAGLAVSVDETPSLSFSDQQKYLKELAAVILQYPERFSADTVNRAASVARNMDFGPLAEYGIGDAYADFTSEFVTQAQAINPLSEQNRGKTSAVLIGAILLAAIAYFSVLAFRTAPARRK